MGLILPTFFILSLHRGARLLPRPSCASTLRTGGRWEPAFETARPLWLTAHPVTSVEQNLFSSFRGGWSTTSWGTARFLTSTTGMAPTTKGMAWAHCSNGWSWALAPRTPYASRRSTLAFGATWGCSAGVSSSLVMVFILAGVHLVFDGFQYLRHRLCRLRYLFLHRLRCRRHCSPSHPRHRSNDSSSSPSSSSSVRSTRWSPRRSPLTLAVFTTLLMVPAACEPTTTASVTKDADYALSHLGASLFSKLEKSGQRLDEGRLWKASKMLGSVGRALARRCSFVIPIMPPRAVRGDRRQGETRDRAGHRGLRRLAVVSQLPKHALLRVPQGRRGDPQRPRGPRLPHRWRLPYVKHSFLSTCLSLLTLRRGWQGARREVTRAREASLSLDPSIRRALATKGEATFEILTSIVSFVHLQLVAILNPGKADQAYTYQLGYEVANGPDDAA